MIENKIKKLTSEKIVAIEETISRKQYFLHSQLGDDLWVLSDKLNSELAERCEKAFKEFYETNKYAKENWDNSNPPETIDYSRLDFEVAPWSWSGPIWHITW